MPSEVSKCQGVVIALESPCAIVVVKAPPSLLPWSPYHIVVQGIHVSASKKQRLEKESVRSKRAETREAARSRDGPAAPVSRGYHGVRRVFGAPEAFLQGLRGGGPWKEEAQVPQAPPSPHPDRGGAVLAAAPGQAPPPWPAVWRKRAGPPWRWAAAVGQSASMGPEHQAASAQGFSVQRLLDQAPAAAQRARQPSTGERSARESIDGCRLC
ncbi:hypothetical protein MTO96_023229 [Rhipicephalus appendiculatus]